MARDIVIGQRGALRRKRPYLAVRDEPEFDERLEAVAYAEDKPVALFQKFHHLFGDARIAERRGDKLAAAVRFVAAGKPARESDDICAGDRRRNCLHALFDVLRAAIAHDDGLAFRSCQAEAALCIQFAVRSGEYGNKHARAGSFDCALFVRFYGMIDVARLPLRRGMIGEHAVKRAAERGDRLFLRYLFFVVNKIPFRSFADEDLRAMQQLGIFEGNQQFAVVFGEQAVAVSAETETEPVAEAGLCDRRRNAAVFNDGSEADIPALYIFMNFAVHIGKLAEVGYLAEILMHRDPIYLCARFFKHVRDESARLCGRERKGDQRGRNVDMLKSAAHAVFPADGAKPQPDLRVQRAEQRGQRNAPAGGILPEAHEKLLEGQPDLVIIASRSDQFCDRSHDAVNCPRKRARAHQRRAVSVGGNCGDVCLSPAYLRRHRDGGSELPPAAERHIDAARTDRRIEHLRKSLFGTDVQRRERTQ